MGNQDERIAELAEKVRVLEEEKNMLLLEKETMNSMFDSAFELIALKDTRLVYQKANQRYCRFFGIEPMKSSGKKMKIFFFLKMHNDSVIVTGKSWTIAANWFIMSIWKEFLVTPTFRSPKRLYPVTTMV